MATLNLASPFLCVITDDFLCPVTSARKALEGGASMIQLRNKTASCSQLLSWGREIRELCSLFGALFIMNDRIDVAMACAADGVHLGQQDIPAKAARKMLGDRLIIGVSSSTPDEALQAEQDGADYIGFGHIFPTSSKEKSYAPAGMVMLEKTASILSIPVIAIGGIDAGNAFSLIAAGASGIAVISAVTRAESPAEAAKALVMIINNLRR
ncbi:MAG: thiamine phosphate synthase [Chlorobiaceae bacterium]|nr:thiamine phosphate synthase [Chlorobiaceae bacterium]